MLITLAQPIARKIPAHGRLTVPYCLIGSDDLVAGFAAWDTGLHAPVYQCFPEPISIIAPVGQ